MTGTLRVINNRFYVNLSYKDPETGHWKIKTVSTKLPAKNNKRKAEAMIPKLIDKYSYLEEDHSIGLGLAKDIMLHEYTDHWLADKQIELRNSTYETYVYRVNKMKEYWMVKKTLLKDLTPKILDEYFKYLMKFGKTNQKTLKKEPLSVRSVRDYRSILYSVLDQAVIDGYLITNPIASVRIRGKKSTESSQKYLFLTEEEIAELLHFLQEYNPRLVPIAFMGAYYGLRRSEILGLKWDAIDWEKKVIDISHTVVRIKTTQACDATKTASSYRSLVLFETGEKCLKNLLKEQEVNKEFFQGSYLNCDNYVFTWENGAPYSPDYITSIFSEATKAFGRPEITLHTLRHSCASMLFDKGWNLKQVQYWLGHSDATTTLNIYTHFNRQRLNTSSNDLAEISLASADLF